MTLIVENKGINLYFILFLKRRIIRHLATILNPKRLVPYDEYFSSVEFRKLTGEKIISSRTVIMMGVTNLIHRRYDSHTHIFINPNILYPGTDLKIVDLCKLINYGSISVDSYPIFSDTFEHFTKNMNKYLDSCIRGMG